MPALIETIAVVNKSGKAVSTSKHLVNVFKEAKAAYQERKAEVVAGRHASHQNQKGTQRAIKATVEDDHHSNSSRRQSSSHCESPRRGSQERRRSGGTPRSGSASPNTIYPSSHNRFSQELALIPPQTPPRSPGTQRSYTTQDDALTLIHRKPVPRRSRSSSDIDMALAYGELPEDGAVSRGLVKPEDELRPLVGKVKRLLEEADCLQYSATAIMASLQKNPETMAAVALTLAEISNVASKLAPGALMTLKGSAPAVFALLAAPEFLIAGGVALGVTVVAFGGYKIIKRIKAKNALEKENSKGDEMLVIGVDVDSINNWRRGISNYDDAGSAIVTEVDSTTPQADAMSRLQITDKDRAASTRSSSKVSSKSESSRNSKSSSKKDGKVKEKKAKEKKVKKPSPLRLMFS